MLAMSNVDTVYGQIPMLRKVSIVVGEGEAVSILGANGAGKTTLLKTIIGMVQPTAGTVELLGERIDTLPTHKIVQKGVAIVPEREGLFPRLTVEVNLRLGAYYETDRRKILEGLNKAYAVFPRLKERARQRAGTLSGGERKMLGIARAMMANPRLILMDEPSLGLAPATVNEVFAAISWIKKERRVAILLVEQNAGKALSLAERAYILQKGEVVVQGTSEEIRKSSIMQQAYLLSER